MDPFEAVFGQQSGERAEVYFERSDEVAEVAAHLLSEHLTLARLRGLSIAYLLQQGTDPQHGQGRESTIDTIAKAVKAPPIWQELAHVLAVVWVNGKAWQVLGQRQREAVVLHELLHLDVDEKTGKLVMLKHDVEEFGYVVAHYGAWHGGLERFGEQLGLFAEGTGGIVAAAGHLRRSLAEAGGGSITAGGRTVEIPKAKAEG